MLRVPIIIRLSSTRWRRLRHYADERRDSVGDHEGQPFDGVGESRRMRQKR